MTGRRVLVFSSIWSKTATFQVERSLKEISRVISNHTTHAVRIKSVATPQNPVSPSLPSPQKFRLFISSFPPNMAPPSLVNDVREAVDTFMATLSKIAQDHRRYVFLFTMLLPRPHIINNAAPKNMCGYWVAWGALRRPSSALRHLLELSVRRSLRKQMLVRVFFFLFPYRCFNLTIYCTPLR